MPDLIEEASSIVVGYLGCDPSAGADDVPADVAIVTSRMVARAMRQSDSSAPAGVSQMGRTMGPFQEQWTLREGVGSGSPWLENVDKVTLKRFRCGGGMVSVRLGGEQTGRFR